MSRPDWPARESQLGRLRIQHYEDPAPGSCSAAAAVVVPAAAAGSFAFDTPVGWGFSRDCLGGGFFAP